MDKHKKIFKLEKPSLFLPVLPYFAFYRKDLFSLFYFNYPGIIILLFILITSEVFFRLINEKNKIILKFISIGLVTSVIIFFYGLVLVNLSDNWQIKHFQHQLLRGRVTITACFLIIFLLQVIFINKSKFLYTLINTFFIIFFCITVISSQKVPMIQEAANNNNFINIVPNDSIKKPIILIISDEYSSPVELNNVFKDSSIIYGLSNRLKQSGWIITNNFFSHEESTIHSLSSLFNFNLSSDKNFSKRSIQYLGYEKFMKAKLSDSLKMKNIIVINYGIFDLGSNKPLTRLYFYPKSFTEQLLMYTIFPDVFYNTGGLKVSGLEPSFYPMTPHNKYIFETLKDTINSIINPGTFVYAHLFIPHPPFTFEPEFKKREKNLFNYFEYWRFTNRKLEVLLTSISENHNYRIIFTGDHGYRDSDKIDRYYTFSAFWGFEKEDIDKIKSVQDLGSLIYGYF